MKLTPLRDFICLVQSPRLRLKDSVRISLRSVSREDFYLVPCISAQGRGSDPDWGFSREVSQKKTLLTQLEM